MTGLMVKPTHRCNLDCKYCFSKRFDEREDMNLKTVERIAESVSNSRNNIKWTWHGGEPLMKSIEFYRESNLILNKYGINNVSMQTNGTRLNEDLLKEFKSMGWGIGFSFDFTSHSRLRGMSEDVIRNIKLYQDIYERKTGAIKIIEGRSVYDFHKDYFLAKDMKMSGITFNKVFDSEGVVSLRGKTGVYLKELTKMIDIWLDDDNPVHIRNIEGIIDSILGVGSMSCSYKGNCVGRWFGINPNGDVYPCERYLSERYKYGNIYDNEDLDSLLEESGNYYKVKEISYRRKEYCRENCNLYEFCNGGCNVIAINDNGGCKPVEYSCELFKKEFYHIFNIIKDIDYTDIKNPDLREKFIRAGLRRIDFINEVLEG